MDLETDAEIGVYVQGNTHNLGELGSFTVNLETNRSARGSVRLGYLVLRTDYWYPVRATDTAAIRSEVAADWTDHGLPWVRSAIESSLHLVEFFERYGLFSIAFELDPTRQRLGGYVDLMNSAFSAEKPELWEHCSSGMSRLLGRAARLGVRLDGSGELAGLKQTVGEVLAEFPQQRGFHRREVEVPLLALAVQLGWDLERLVPTPRRWNLFRKEEGEQKISSLPFWLPETTARPKPDWA